MVRVSSKGEGDGEGKYEGEGEGASAGEGEGEGRLASVSPARREARWAPPLHTNIVTVRKLRSIAGGVCPSCGPPA